MAEKSVMRRWLATYSALGHTWNSVLVIGTSLSNSVPMNGGGIVLQQIYDLHLDDVTLT